MRLILVFSIALLSIACSNEGAKRRHFDRAEQLLRASKLPEAIIELRNAVDLDELWGEARYLLAEAYAANGEPELAYKQYLRAADLMPDNAAAQLKAAAYLLLAGQYEDAKTRAQRLLEKDPGNVDALIALGNALAGLRELDGAATTITEAIQLDPGRSHTYANLARVRVAQGRRDEARAAFEKAVETDATSIAAHLARANFQWSAGELGAAEASLKRVLAIDSGNVLTHRVLATLYLASGRSLEAEEHLKFVAKTTKTDAALFSLADYYVASGRPEDARRILLPLEGRRTSKAGADTRLANILYSEGATTEGHQLLDGVLARDPNNSTALVLQARWLLSEGRPEQALERAKAALAASPRMIVARYVCAEAEARTRRTADAIGSLVEVLRVNPQDADAQARLSALHLARNQIDSAVQLAEEALSNAPESVDARLALIRALIVRGDLTIAATELAALKRRAPAAAGVHIVEGSLRMRTGDTHGARLSFERTLQLDAGSREGLIGLTTVDVLGKQVTQARACIESRLAAAAEDPELLLLAAKVFLAAGDASRAEEVLRRAIVLDPLDAENFALLARIFTEQQKLDSATNAFDEEARRDPTNVAARIMSAILLHTKGELPAAKRRYEEILKLEPRAALAANNLAAIYADEGHDLPYAQQLAESAVETLPAHAGIRDTLGWIYFRRELYGLAIVQFQQSVAREPANPVYQYHLGLAYSKSGETERARELLHKAIELNPRLTGAQQALAALDERPLAGRLPL